MGKRGRILIVVVAISVVGVVGWSIFHAWSAPPEPMYQGRPLSYWLLGYSFPFNGTNAPSRADADAAIKDAGTNAIPLLLQMLRAHDSPLKTKLLRWTCHDTLTSGNIFEAPVN